MEGQENSYEGAGSQDLPLRTMNLYDRYEKSQVEYGICHLCVCVCVRMCVYQYACVYEYACVSVRV